MASSQCAAPSVCDLHAVDEEHSSERLHATAMAMAQTSRALSTLSTWCGCMHTLSCDKVKLQSAAQHERFLLPHHRAQIGNEPEEKWIHIRHGMECNGPRAVELHGTCANKQTNVRLLCMAAYGLHMLLPDCCADSSSGNAICKLV